MGVRRRIERVSDLHVAVDVGFEGDRRVRERRERQLDPVDTCPPATLKRILSVLTSPLADLESEMRLRMGLSTPVLPDLRS